MNLFFFLRPNQRSVIMELSLYIFYLVFATYCLLLVTEGFFAGVVTNFFNPQHLLLPMVFVGGIGMILQGKRYSVVSHSKKSLAKNLGLSAAVVVFLGWLLWHRLDPYILVQREITGLILAAMFVLMTIMVLSDRETPQD